MEVALTFQIDNNDNLEVTNSQHCHRLAIIFIWELVPGTLKDKHETGKVNGSWHSHLNTQNQIPKYTTKIVDVTQS